MSESAKPWPAMSIAEAHKIITAPGMPCEMEEIVIRGVPTRVWKNAPPWGLMSWKKGIENVSPRQRKPSPKATYS